MSAERPSTVRLSVNIESPADLSASAASYFPTSQSIEFVRGLASAALNGGGAHALLGPYGVGKSSLAAFALNELSYPTSSFEPAARSHLFGSDESPVAEVLSEGGLAPMPIVGAPEPLSTRVALALKTLASDDTVLRGVPALDTYATLDPREASGDQALLMLTEAARTIRQQGRAGALLIIDEFGRHLEHMLSAPGDGDLHLLQNIAEATGRADSPISLVIIQHLGLEHYGSMLHGQRRYEWDKVRGRFLETVLNHTEADAAHIVASVLNTLGVEKVERPALRFPKSAPPVLKDPHFLTAAYECRPLHPMTVVLLSRLAQVLGQNDRTMVGWLASELDSGFRAMRTKARKNGWLYPFLLYEHFFRDALWAPPNPAFAKRFAAIHMAHERMDDDLSVDARLLFKTLALLSFCAGRGLRADRSSALACLPRSFQFDRAIAELTNRSLVLYRHYRGEYVVWEGSDYDVTGHIDEQLPLLSLDVAAEMNQRCRVPVLAHGHLIRTGNRRTASILWLNDGVEPQEAGGEPRILIRLADRAPTVVDTNDVVGAAASQAIEPHLRESTAIRRLLEHDAVLQEDAIATRELKSRREFHEGRIASVCQELLESDLGWRVGESRFSTMQEALSHAMDEVFSRAFTLHNDLVNRDRVSASVAFALRKLIDRLYGSLGEENIGIEKFPAERIIHESMLKGTGLYSRTGDGAWQLRLDGEGLTPGMAACIGEARRLFADRRQPAASSVHDVADHLARPPYGIKQTPAVLLCILILLDDQDAHELYEDGQFLPHWGPDTLIRVLRAPKRFIIAAAAASPVDREFLWQYKKALGAGGATTTAVTPVALARDVLRRHARLSPYAQRTQTISDQAQAFRRALEVATSPGDMLFRKIPEAFGYASLPVQAAVREGFFRSLHAVWRELEEADEALMVRLEGAVLDTLGYAELCRARLLCQEFAKSLLADGGLHHGYEDFLSRICDDEITDHRGWLAKVADDGIGIATPMASWSDAHASQGEFLLRRNFAALKQARNLLAECTVERDASPFAIFWPNPDVALRDAALEVSRQIEALADSLPPKDRRAVIVSLAENSRSTK